MSEWTQTVRVSAFKRRMVLVAGLTASATIIMVHMLHDRQSYTQDNVGQPKRLTQSNATVGKGQAAPKEDERVGGSQPAVSLEPYTLKPPLSIYSALSFGPEGGTPTYLVGVEAPSSGAVCKDDQGHLWACGLQGRAALNNLIRTKTITCMPEAVRDTQVNAHCQVEGHDLASLLIERGFARLTEGRSSDTQDQARQARLGMWNGSWTLRY